MMGKLFLALLLPGLLISAIMMPASSAPEHPLEPKTAAEETRQEEEFTAAQLEFFESKVRPLLVEHCYDCHGPDADPPEGGLSLVSRRSIMAGGDSGPGVDLDNLAESLVLTAVEYGDLFEMPPDSKLGDEEVEIIRKWVMDKAPWPADSDIEVARNNDFDLAERKAEHWCWRPISHPAIPDVQDETWPTDGIDHFILSKLEAAGLQPAQSADRRTWLRRVTFDLTGLPPTPQELEAFVNDESKDAFEKVVDRLLDSPRFGERWARHWMDLVRYAETCGHEFDYPIPNAFRYRDYVIRAFNADVPYNDLVVEHIAGDLIQKPRRNPDNEINESVLGTGFWFLGEATHGPVDVKGDEAGRIDNQIDVMTKTFLGLTVACARCHDHKFDAISDEDYYGLSGFLQSSRRQNVMLDPHRKIERAHTRASAESKSIASQVEDFLRSLDDSGKHFLSYENYIRGSIEFLQQDSQWKLPDHLVLEGETLSELERTSGSARRQDIKGWSGGGQMWWTGAGVGDHLELEFETPIAGEYEIAAQFTKARDYGIVQASINGKPAGKPIDLYNSSVIQSGEVSLGRFSLEEGVQTLRLKIVGKNKEAIDQYMFGLDYLVLKADQQSVNATDETARIEKLCDRLTLDPRRLRNWVAAIRDSATTSMEHPFYILRKSAEAEIDLDSDAGDEFYSELFGQLSELENANQRWLAEQSELLEPLQSGELQNWSRQGFAFQADYHKGQVNFADGSPIWSDEFAPPHSGMLGSRFQGVLRSPTFEITHPNLFYYISARNAKIRLIIDGFRLDVNNPLLFNAMKLDVNTDGQWKWIQQGGDLKNYIGHRAFIEIIDEGDGFIGVQEVRFADHAPPSGRPSPVSVAPHHHILVDGNWHDGRYNNGSTPLQLVSESMAISMQAASMYSAADATVRDEKLFNFMANHNLIPEIGERFGKLKEQIAYTRQQLAQINAQVPNPMMAIGMIDGSPEDEYVFIRGNHKNPGEPVLRGPIEALKNAETWPSDLRTSGRMELAQNMVAPDHPLTRRVIVNRVWHHLTGKGLVSTVDNFGVLGAKPTHPELLDYMASEFSDAGWSIKKLIRRIVLSQTYRMSSVSDVNASVADPKNDLLYKFRIRRLQGEAIRDSILAVSGELKTKMFGPGVPIHLTDFMQGRGRPGKSGPQDGNGRRSVYVEVRRNFLSPMMLAFDTPIPFNAIGRRTNSNVPAQALIMLNDPMVIDQAGKWARRLIEEHSDPEARLKNAFESAMGRLPTDKESGQLLSFVESQGKLYGDDSSETKVWTDLCHVLFNMKEFVYIK